MAIVLSGPAEQDVESILEYSLAKWDNVQFEHYYTLIQTTLNEIERDPNFLACRQREDLFAGCYAKPFGRYIIFYRLANSGIEVVRILHEMMDYGSHF